MKLSDLLREMQSKGLVSIKGGFGTIVYVPVVNMPEHQGFHDILILLGNRGAEWLEYNAQASDYLWNKEAMN